MIKLIEIVLNFSELQRFCSGPDSRAIVQPQALVRGVPVISSVMNQVISLVLLPLEWKILIEGCHWFYSTDSTEILWIATMCSLIPSLQDEKHLEKDYRIYSYSYRVGFCTTTPDPFPRQGYCRLLATVSGHPGVSHPGRSLWLPTHDNCLMVILWLQALPGVTHWYYNW